VPRYLIARKSNSLCGSAEMSAGVTPERLSVPIAWTRALMASTVAANSLIAFGSLEMIAPVLPLAIAPSSSLEKFASWVTWPPSLTSGADRLAAWAGVTGKPSSARKAGADCGVSRPVIPPIMVFRRLKIAASVLPVSLIRVRVPGV